MRPTEELMTEHRAIERMLAVMDSAARRLQANEPVRPQALRDAVDFLQNFADRCHHGKEEDSLFPRLEAAGIPREGGPLGVMLFEHGLGREHIAAMAKAIDAYEAGDASAGLVFAENARDYGDLLRQHIMKEENVLFPMADAVLTRRQQDDIVQQFERVESELMGPGVHERYHALLDELEKEMALAGA